MAAVTEAEIDLYEMTIEETLMELDDGELTELAEGLNIAEGSWKDKRRLIVLRCIRHYIEKALGELEEPIDKKNTLMKYSMQSR